MSSNVIEHNALKVSALGAFFMASLGLGFGIWTQSEAILLDGLFSLVSFCIGGITLKVSTLINQPTSKNYQFGLSALEPLLNLTKGLIMTFLCGFAVVNAVKSIMNGGRELDGLLAFSYAVIAGVGCFLVFFNSKRCYKKTNSPILNVDASNWLIDGIISGAVGLAFLAAFFMQDGAAKPIIPYLDSIIVLVLVLAVIKIPYALIRDNFHQVLLGAPNPKLQEAIRQDILEIFADLEYQESKFRMGQSGRFITVIACFLVSDDLSLSRLDAYSLKLHDLVQKSYPHTFIEPIICKDKQVFAMK